jgi:hypothetical protein
VLGGGGGAWAHEERRHRKAKQKETEWCRAVDDADEKNDAEQEERGWQGDEESTTDEGEVSPGIERAEEHGCGQSDLEEACG